MTVLATEANVLFNAELVVEGVGRGTEIAVTVVAGVGIGRLLVLDELLVDELVAGLKVVAEMVVATVGALETDDTGEVLPLSVVVIEAMLVEVGSPSVVVIDTRALTVLTAEAEAPVVEAPHICQHRKLCAFFMKLIVVKSP